MSILTTPPKLNAVVAGISRGETVSQAVMFARDLVNEPPSFTTPTHLADVAGKLVKGHANMSCEVFGPKEMKTLGMEAILGIARGSDEEPRFIHLSYKGGGEKLFAWSVKALPLIPADYRLKIPKTWKP